MAIFETSAAVPSPPGTNVVRRIVAYSVHALTASGALLGLFCLDALIRSDLRTAFLWMAAALAVDMFDGTLARLVNTKRFTPEFDGALLDNIVDYFNYVAVPAFFLVRTDLLPPDYRWIAAGLVCVCSGYQFSRKDAKTDDHYFVGFPSEWNLLVFYLTLFGLPEYWNLAIVLVLLVLIFVPIKYLYPSRTERFRRTTLSLSAVWFVSTAVVLYQYPHPHVAPLSVSLLYILYYFGASFLINWQGRYR